jgi:hypothetical protein
MRRQRRLEMRNSVKKKLNRVLWVERAKLAGAGLAIVAAIAVAFKIETLDLAVTDVHLAGAVEALDPLVSKTSAATGLNVGVALADGRHVRVIADKSNALKIGDRIQITEHRHATGRVTHTFK